MAAVQEIHKRTTIVSHNDLDTTGHGYSTLRSVLYTALNVIEALLAIRLLLRLFAANPNNGLVNALYAMTDVLVAPFTGIFSSVRTGAGIFETNTLIAMAVYALLVYAIAALARPRQEA